MVLPPPSLFDLHLPCLMVVARVVGFRYSLFENKRPGATKKGKTFFFLPTIRDQKAAEFGKLTYRTTQSQMKRILEIFHSDFDPWLISFGFHCGLYEEAAEKKSRNVLDLSEQVEFLKFRFAKLGIEIIHPEGLWLGCVHAEPLSQPLPPPPSTVINVMCLQRHFHFFPP